MLLVCLWDNILFTLVFKGLYAPLKYCLCVCGRKYHVHVFLCGFDTFNWNGACVYVGECIMCTCFCLGFIRLFEMLLVCLWENVSCARVSKVYTLHWHVACVYVELFAENVLVAHVFRGRFIGLIEGVRKRWHKRGDTKDVSEIMQLIRSRAPVFLATLLIPTFNNCSCLSTVFDVWLG